jgi:hypothetical protein
VKEVLIVGGQVALIDDEDFEKVNQFKWRLSEKGYAVANHKGKKIRMHRLVMGAVGDQVVDHRKHNKLDNQKANLRITDRSGNACNRQPQQRGDIKYKGVYKNAGRFEARIKINQRPHYLGRFETAEEAALAYNTAAKDLHGEMACLNVL